MQLLVTKEKQMNIYSPEMGFIDIAFANLDVSFAIALARYKCAEKIAEIQVKTKQLESAGNTSFKQPEWTTREEEIKTLATRFDNLYKLVDAAATEDNKNELHEITKQLIKLLNTQLKTIQ